MLADPAAAEALIDVLVNGLHQGGLWYGADDCVYPLPALVDYDCWNAADAILCGDAWTLICVELELQGMHPGQER